jgi:lysophospholipase L1-like esterase
VDWFIKNDKINAFKANVRFDLWWLHERARRVVVSPGAAEFFRRACFGPGTAERRSSRQRDSRVISPFPFALLLLVSVLSASDLKPVVLRGHLTNSRNAFETTGKGRVVFLGGSITENKTGHCAMIPVWLRERFPATDFSFVNAGISSTCSHTGAFRLERDVLAGGPVDLLFVEFAVNDDQDAAHDRQEAIRGMEGIVRHVRRSSPNTDIVMIDFVNPEMLAVFQKGKVPVSVAAHEAVAEHYAVPSVNVGLALALEIAAGRKTWERDYGGTHPNPAGYRFVSDLLIGMLSRAWEEPGKGGEHEVPPALDPHSFADGTLVDPASASWMGGWSSGPCGPGLLPVGAIRGTFRDQPLTVASEPGAALTFQFSGTACGVFVLAGPDAGIIESSLDEGPFVNHDLFHRHSAGLNYPRTVMLHQGLSDGPHTLVLRVSETANTASQGHRIPILQFAVNR